MTQKQPDPKPPACIIAEFRTADALLVAARRVRDAGYRRFDVHCPFLIHGMDDAMGLRRSPLGWIVLGGAVTGITVAFLLQWYTAVVDYPLVTAGKPYNSLPVWVIIMFELGVLFASFAAVFGMFILNGMPAWYHPSLKHEAFLAASNDGFFMVIDAADKRFGRIRTRTLLEEIGGHGITCIEHEE